MQSLNRTYVYALASCNCSAAFQAAARCNCATAPIRMLLPYATAMALMFVLLQHATALLPLVPRLHALLYRNSADAIALCNHCVALKVSLLRNSTHADAVARATLQRHSCIAACNCSAAPSAAALCNCSAAPLPMLLPHATAV